MAEIRIRNDIALPSWVRRALDRGQTPPPIVTVPVGVTGERVWIEL